MEKVWLLTSVHFLLFLDIDENIKSYVHAPTVFSMQDTADFPILQTILIPSRLIRNRSLMIHITGEKAETKGIEGMLKKVSNLFSSSAHKDLGTIRGKLLVLKEEEPDSNSFQLKSTIDLIEIVTYDCLQLLEND